jgi:hypothetical protein
MLGSCGSGEARHTFEEKGSMMQPGEKSRGDAAGGSGEILEKAAQSSGLAGPDGGTGAERRLLGNTCKLLKMQPVSWRQGLGGKENMVNVVWVWSSEDQSKMRGQVHEATGVPHWRG